MSRILFSAALAVALFAVSASTASAQNAIDRLQQANDERNAQIEADAGGTTDPAAPAEAEESGGKATPAAPARRATVPPNQRLRPDKWDDSHSVRRLKAPSAAWWKLLIIGLAMQFWILSGDWVNQKVNEHELGYATWNAVMLVPPLIAGVLVLLVPLWFVTLPLLVAACVAPLFVYGAHHNKSVEDHQKVLNSEWFKFAAAQQLAKLGVKVQTEKKAAYEAGAPVDLSAQGGDERTQQANLLTARQSPGYVLVKDLIAELVDRGSTRATLDYTPQGVAVKMMIDGVWHSAEARDLDSGNVMLAVMKQLANLDVKDRRAKQRGAFGAKYNSVNYTCPLASQGTKTGERVSLRLTGGSQVKLETYEDIGLRTKLAEEWSDVMSESAGLVVFSALPEGGLTTLMNVSLHETDRLIRDFVAIEPEDKPELDIENIEAVTFNPAAGESPATVLPKIMRKYPDALVVRDLCDDESGKQLMDVVKQGKLLITGTPARDASEAIVRVAQQAPMKGVASTLIGSIGVRLIRKLCTECRVEFEPTPDLLKKLGIPAGKVESLYREPKPEEIEKPCPACGGIGFRGRTALYEVLLPDDRVRETLMTKPKPELVRKAARTGGMRTFQEEGVLLIAKGTTSLSELQRVLKS